MNKQELSIQELTRVYALYIGQDCTYNGNPSVIFSPSFCATNLAKIHAKQLCCLEQKTCFELLKNHNWVDYDFAPLTMEESPEFAAKEGQDIIKHFFREWPHSCNMSDYMTLIREGYAVPLDFGSSHWANGKNIFDLGIAVEDPKN